jgi:XTP/dITP diphosphohydrolase
MLKNVPVEIIVPNSDFDVEETGMTFEENAILKARAYSEKFPEVFVLADDSGLVVDALDGRPGVYSKRYGDTDEHRNAKLLSELKDVSNSERTARFVSVIALIGQGVEEVFEGVVEGAIGFEARGEDGFGYDPVFIPEGYKKTFAELGTEVKNTLSHRARALEKVKKFLENVPTNV